METVLLHTQQLSNPLLYALLWLPKVAVLSAGYDVSTDSPAVHDEKSSDAIKHTCALGDTYNTIAKKPTPKV